MSFEVTFDIRIIHKFAIRRIPLKVMAKETLSTTDVRSIDATPTFYVFAILKWQMLTLENPTKQYYRTSRWAPSKAARRELGKRALMKKQRDFYNYWLGGRPRKVPQSTTTRRRHVRVHGTYRPRRGRCAIGTRPSGEFWPRRATIGNALTKGVRRNGSGISSS